MPFFNRLNNDDLTLAIQAAVVSRGRNGFRKDKGGGNSPRARRISQNTEPTAHMPSIRYTSVARNSHNVICLPSTLAVCYKKKSARNIPCRLQSCGCHWQQCHVHRHLRQAALTTAIFMIFDYKSSPFARLYSLSQNIEIQYSPPNSEILNQTTFFVNKSDAILI